MASVSLVESDVTDSIVNIGALKKDVRIICGEVWNVRRHCLDLASYRLRLRYHYRDRRIQPSAEVLDHEYRMAADGTLLQRLRIMGVFQCRTKDEQNRNVQGKRGGTQA